MFEINTQYKINSTLPIITDNYKVLHFDEFPILFSGTNKYNNKLIGSLSYENEENESFRYFVIVVEDKQYYKFFNKKISYLELIQESQELFVIDKDINNTALATYHVPLEAIPSDYLPHKSSYIPERKSSSNSLSFAFSLKGKLADLHKALVNDVNSVNQRIYSYLEESIDTLKNLSLDPKIYSQPSQVGSYRLNFDVELKSEGQMNLFQIDHSKVGKFINGYLQYITYALPDEDEAFLTHSPENSKKFQSLQNSLIDIYTSGNLQPPSAITDILIDSINESATKLSEVTEFIKFSESFNAIEIGNYEENGEFSSIGYIDADYRSSIVTKLLPEETQVDELDIISDESPEHYRILVFRLNRDTGKGGARLYYDNEDFSTIKLNIYKGENELSNSIFTKSLDEDKVVDVKGIATRINGIYKKLDCYL